MKKKKVFPIQTVVIIIESVVILILFIFLLIPKSNEDNSEVEKKWLISQSDIPYDLSNADVYDIYQTYINFSPEIRVRNINNEEYVLTIKTDDPAYKGLKRTEQEYFITEEEYQQLLTKKTGATIHKTRYSLRLNGRLHEIDIFHDNLAGLAYLEIEFENEQEASEYQQPTWVIADVTTDLNYKNGYLARYGIPQSFNNYMKRIMELTKTFAFMPKDYIKDGFDVLVQITTMDSMILIVVVILSIINIVLQKKTNSTYYI